MAVALGKKVETTQQAPVSLWYNNNFWYTWVIPPLVLTIITVLFYYPSLYYAFQFDDLPSITKFYDIRHKTLSDLFFSNSRWISYWLNTLYYHIGRFNPFYYRLGNVIFHTLSGVILFYVLVLAFKNLKKESFFRTYAVLIAFVAAGLFMLHPVQTQTVSYVIQGQLEGLAGLFVLSMTLCFLLFSFSSSLIIKSIMPVLLFLLAFFACGTKEIVIVTPAVLLLMDWFFVAQGNWQSLKSRWWLHAGVGLIVFGCYLYFLKPGYFKQVFGFSIVMRNNVGNVLTENFNDRITSWNYFTSQFKVILHYISIFFWPFNISVDYDWRLAKNFFAVDCFFPFLILLSLAIALLKRWYRYPTDVLCWAALWWFIVLLPRSSIIPSTELMVDYKTYVASIGIHVLMASSIVFCALYCIKRFSLHAHSIVLFLTMPLVCVGYLAYERNKVWRTATEFWANVVKNSPGRARSHNNYGTALSEAGKPEQAIDCFKKAIQLDPLYPDPLNNIAVSYSMIGQVDNAIEAIKKSIKLQPYYPEGYNNLASFLMQKKDYDQAEKALKQAIKLRPHYGKAYLNLGRIYEAENKLKDAYEAYKSSCTKADFDNELGFLNFGMMCLRLHYYDEAIDALGRALAFNPQAFETSFYQATAYLLNNNSVKAEEIYLKIFKWRADVRIPFNLGEIYFNRQNYREALRWYEKALELKSPVEALPMKIAECFNKLGQPREAEVVLQQFIMSNPRAELQQKAEHGLNLLKNIKPKRKPQGRKLLL